MATSEFQPDDGLTTEEAAELANVMPPTLEDAYAEGRKDEREDLHYIIAALREIAAMTYDTWSNGHLAGQIAHDAIAKFEGGSQLRPAMKIAAPDKDAILRGAAIMRGLKEPPTVDRARLDPWEADKDAQMNPATDGDPGRF